MNRVIPWGPRGPKNFRLLIVGRKYQRECWWDLRRRRHLRVWWRLIVLLEIRSLAAEGKQIPVIQRLWLPWSSFPPKQRPIFPPKHLLTIFYLWNRHRSGIWTHMCKKSSNSNKFHSKIIGTKVWNSHRGRECSGVSSSSPSVSTKESFGQNFTFQIWLKNLFSAWFTFDFGCSGSGFRF